MSILRPISGVKSKYIHFDVEIANLCGVEAAVIFSILLDMQSLSEEEIQKKIPYIEKHHIQMGLHILFEHELIQQSFGKWQVI